MNNQVSPKVIRSAYDSGLRDGERRAQAEANRRAWTLIMTYARERQVAYQRTLFGWAASISGLLVALFALQSLLQPNLDPRLNGGVIALLLLGLAGIAFGFIYHRHENRKREARIEQHNDRWRAVVEVEPDLGVMRLKSSGDEPANASPDT